jgi:predicted nucleic acid-binding Zn ribbon protein
VDRVTAVRLEGRVLLVDAASRAWANEVTRSSPVILKRLQTLLGKEALASISVRDH